MSQKLIIKKINQPELKQVPPITQVRRYGEISLMTINAIYGLQGVYCTKCVV